MLLMLKGKLSVIKQWKHTCIGFIYNVHISGSFNILSVL